MKRPSNIILIGFMGSGKTTTAREISKILGLQLIDLDKWIEEKNKNKISEIFEINGEAYFRKEERKAIQWLSRQKNYVASIGGGAWIPEANQKRLLHMGWCVWLKVSPGEVWRRIHREYQGRPLLAESKSPIQKIKALLTHREALYKKAHFHFNTDETKPKKVAVQIAKTYKRLQIHF